MGRVILLVGLALAAGACGSSGTRTTTRTTVPPVAMTLPPSTAQAGSQGAANPAGPTTTRPPSGTTSTAPAQTVPTGSASAASAGTLSTSSGASTTVTTAAAAATTVTTRPATVTTTTQPPPASGTVQVTSADNGRTVDARVGQTVQIVLSGCGGCGYEWSMTGQPSPAVFQYEGETTGPSSPTTTGGPPAGGAPVTYSWSFKAVAAHTTGFQAAYTGPGSTSPTQQFSVTLAVQP